MKRFCETLRFMSQKISINVPFSKFHGAGNDFILVDASNLQGVDPGSFAQSVCERNFGVGSDGLIVLEPSRTADSKMVFFNPDGSRDVCGNGMRCVALYHYRANPFGSFQLEIDNDTVLICALDHGKQFRVQMHVREQPRVMSLDTSVGVIEGLLVNTGTPHFVTTQRSLELSDIKIIGPELENNAIFDEPVSIDFVERLDANRVDIRIWERSAGETLACGTAACAVAVTGISIGELISPVTVQSKGGTLTVSYDEQDLFLTGPAQHVFDGVFTYSKSHR